MTGQEVEALRIRMSDLRRELQDAAERRNAVANRLRSADMDARPGYQERLKVLDERIIGIEQELTTAGIQLRSAPAGALLEGTTREPDPNLIIDRISSDLVPIVAILAVFVFAPFAIALSRFIWRRSTPTPRVVAATDQATQQKLDTLQQAVDTIAIEVERISEGQRFVTRVLNDRAIGGGAAEPVRASMKSAVPSERG